MPSATQARPVRLDKHRSLLTVLCRRNAADLIDSLDSEHLSDEGFLREFLELADRHRVLGLVLAVLLRTGILDGLAGPGARRCQLLFQDLRRRATLLEVKRDHVVTVLQDANADPVLLKGAALSSLYNEPVERHLSDLDLLLSRDAVDQALRTLVTVGYSLPSVPGRLEVYRSHHFHIPVYHATGHTVEIHWALARPGAPLRIDPTAVLDQAIGFDRPDHRVVRIPRPEYMLLHLVLQNYQEGFTRLSRIVDIDRLIASTHSLDFDFLLGEARKGNLTSSAALSFQLASRLLGTAPPDGVLRALLPPLVSRLHVTMMQPVGTLLIQRSSEGHARQRLLEFWLLRRIRDRAKLLFSLLTGSVGVRVFPRPRLGLFHRILSLGKLVFLQISLYFTTAISQATPSGRAQMRFWSSHAKSSERL